MGVAGWHWMHLESSSQSGRMSHAWLRCPIQILLSWIQRPTGLSGGVGTYAFLIGVARFENDGLYLAQFFMSDPSLEAGQLAALEEFLAPCQAIVTFNGKAFDAPLLITRYLSHGWQPPFS